MILAIIFGAFVTGIVLVVGDICHTERVIRRSQNRRRKT